MSCIYLISERSKVALTPDPINFLIWFFNLMGENTMKAQVLHKYDPNMKEKVWVTGEELPNPKIEKASDVIVKIGAAGVCRTDLHIIEGVWKHIQDPEGKLLPCVMGHENAGWIEDVG